MIHPIPQPPISPSFTIEDIHAIREWNYQRLKDATAEERITDINAGARPVLEQIEAIRANRGRLNAGASGAD
jgi:hypothetical protein